MKVLIKNAALNKVDQLAYYIALEIKMPETALKYTQKLIDFGYNLNKYYKLHPLCRNSKLAKQGLHCATFDKKWVFAYKIGTKNIIIHHIIWAGGLK